MTPAQFSGISLCESVHAGPVAPWHLRRLTANGPKYGGGIDTECFCGHARPPYGWDLEVKITQHHLDQNTSPLCLAAAKVALDESKS